MPGTHEMAGAVHGCFWADCWGGGLKAESAGFVQVATVSLPPAVGCAGAPAGRRPRIDPCLSPHPPFAAGAGHGGFGGRANFTERYGDREADHRTGVVEGLDKRRNRGRRPGPIPAIS